MGYDLVKTKYPGIYKRQTKDGTRYVVVWLYRGKQHRKSYRTLAEAREAQGERRRLSERKPVSRITFEEYALRWLDTYTGRPGRGGVGEGTMTGYRRSMTQWAIPYLGHLRLGEIERGDLRGLVRHMQTEGVKPATVRAHMVPVRALFATAVDDNEIRDNPASRLGLGGAESGRAKAMTREELRVVLAALPDKWRGFFVFLAQTGLRISEAVAVTWDDLDLGASPHVKVRRQNYRGKVTQLKTKYSVRNVPLSPEMVDLLRQQRAAAYVPGGTVFTNERGCPVDAPNLRNRVLSRTVKGLGLEWVGFHTFRHTCASMLIADGKNPKQVQRWLGHAKASFTLDVYGHLMDEGLGGTTFAPMLAVPPDNAATTQHPQQLQTRQAQSQ